MENVLSNIVKINGKKRRETLSKYAELAKLSKSLATINTEVPIDLDLDTCRVNNFNNTRLKELFTKFGFKSFLADNYDNN